MHSTCEHDHTKERKIIHDLGKLIKVYIDTIISDEEAESDPEKAFQKTVVVNSVLINLTLNVINFYSNEEHPEPFPMNLLRYISELTSAGINDPLEEVETND
jgi:hypothetical protein